MNVFLSKFNFVTEEFNECTTIYSQKALHFKAVGNGNIRVLNVFVK